MFEVPTNALVRSSCLTAGRVVTRGPAIRWECTCCGKLLGIIEGNRVHVKVSRGREYFTGVPAIGTCHRCGTLNEYTGNPEGMKRATHN